MMKKAVQSILDGDMGYLKASQTYRVPKSTLQDHVSKCREIKSTNKLCSCLKTVI